MKRKQGRQRVWNFLSEIAQETFQPILGRSRAMATLQGSSLGLKFPPSPSLFSPTVASRFKNESFSVLASRSWVAYNYNMHRRPTSLCRSSQGSYGELHSFSQRDLQAVANKSVFLRGSDGLISGKMLPIISNKCRFSMCARAKKNKSFSLPFPEMKEKPEWWWRTLACVPYLISMQISDAGFYVNPLLRHKESFESLIFYIPGGAKRLPTWFPMLYIYLAYFGVVKNKEWPHFFRYHVVMAMLLETMVQVIWHSSNFMPLIHWSGTFGMYYWAAVGFAYICVILECIRCALGGNYVKIPFVSEAALIHTLFHVGGFYKSF